MRGRFLDVLQEISRVGFKGSAKRTWGMLSFGEPKERCADKSAWKGKSWTMAMGCFKGGLSVGASSVTASFAGDPGGRDQSACEGDSWTSVRGPSP